MHRFKLMHPTEQLSFTQTNSHEQEHTRFTWTRTRTQSQFIHLDSFAWTRTRTHEKKEEHVSDSSAAASSIRGRRCGCLPYSHRPPLLPPATAAPCAGPAPPLLTRSSGGETLRPLPPLLPPTPSLLPSPAFAASRIWRRALQPLSPHLPSGSGGREALPPPTRAGHEGTMRRGEDREWRESVCERERERERERECADGSVLRGENELSVGNSWKSYLKYP